MTAGRWVTDTVGPMNQRILSVVATVAAAATLTLIFQSSLSFNCWWQGGISGFWPWRGWRVRQPAGDCTQCFLCTCTRKQRWAVIGSWTPESLCTERVVLCLWGRRPVFMLMWWLLSCSVAWSTDFVLHRVSLHHGDRTENNSQPD